MKHEHLDDPNDPRSISPIGDPRDAAFDDALSKALRAEDPGAAFTQRVLARAREERAAQQTGRSEASALRSEVSALRSEVSAERPEVSAVRPAGPHELVTPATAATVATHETYATHTTSATSAPPRVRTMRLTATRKLIAAIAASLTLAAGAQQWMQHRRYVAEGERARAQVLAALRLTNEKLDIVHDKITGREGAR